MSSSDQEKSRERSRSRSPLRFKSPVPDDINEAKETSHDEINEAKDTHHAEISDAKDVPDVDMSEANTPHFETKNVPCAETSKAKKQEEVTKTKETPVGVCEANTKAETTEGAEALCIQSDESDDYVVLHITNLPAEWTINQIKQYFKDKLVHEGRNISYFITILKDPQTRIRTGKYLFKFGNCYDCDRVFKIINGLLVEGKKLIVCKSPSKPKFLEVTREKKGLPNSPFTTQRTASNVFVKQKMPQEPLSYDTYGLNLPFLKSLGISPPLQRYIYVTNLRPDLTKEQLEEVFSIAGQITSMKYFVKKTTGTAIIGYDHPLEAVQAISMFNQRKLHDWVMTVTVDRKCHRPLPKGLESIGPGLGEQGAPLRGVRTTVALKTFKEQFEKDVAAKTPSAGNDANAGNDSSSIQQNVLLAQLSAFLSSQTGNQGKGNNSTSTLPPQSQNVPNFAQNVGRNVPDCGPIVHNSGQNVQNPGQVAPNFVPNVPNFVQNTPNVVQTSPNFVQNPPNFGPTAPNYGLNAPNYGPNAPNYGQHAPNYGQHAPNYEQNIQTYGQPSFVQNASHFDQNPQNNFGQNALNNNLSNMSQQHPVVAMAQVSSNSTKIEHVQQGVPNFSQNTVGKEVDWNTRSSSASTIHSIQKYSADAVHYMEQSSSNSSRRDMDTKSRKSSSSSRYDSNKPTDMLIFSNLPTSVTGQALNEKMREIGELMFGEVTEKGRAIVRFKNRSDAERCIKLFDRSRVDGQTINVKFL